MINKKLLILAIILSLLTAGSVYFYLQKLERQYDDNVYAEVVTAAIDISPNSKLSEEVLKVKKIPVQYVHGEAIGDLDEVIGKITKVPLAADEVILTSNLAEAGDDGLSYKVPEGKRAIAVAVNEVSAVGNFVLPGDRVDIIATLDREENDPQGGFKKITESGFLIQNVPVLAVGSKMERKSGGKNLEITTVTLAVGPKDAPKLVLASERGTIRMLLRSPVEKDTVRYGTVRKRDIFERR